MSTLLDTNILARLSQPGHPHHLAAGQALAVLRGAGEPLYIVPQNVYEFWAVATRPIGVNGLDLTTPQVKAELTRIRSLFVLLPDTVAVFAKWEEIVEVYSVRGKATHDARLVAAMLVHGVAQILTFNHADFARYTVIRAINPLNLTPPSASP